MVFPRTPLLTRVELYIGGTWIDITSDVFGLGSSSSINIHRGRDDGLSNVQPSTATLSLKNTAGKYSLRNPNSVYYGLLGINTPIRIYVSPKFSYGTGMDDYDVFNRVVVDGWGNSGGGNAYALYGAGGSVLTSDWAVNGSYGIQYVPAAPGNRVSILSNLNLMDVDIYATVDTYISNVAGAAIELGGIMVRVQTDYTCYFARVDISASEVMTAKIFYNDATLLASATVSTFAWTGQSVCCRLRIIGSEIEYKIWDAATVEPSAWSVTCSDTTLNLAGTVAFRSGLTTGNTNTSPVEYRWDNINIEAIYSRFVGEIPEWPITIDGTGSDIRTSITASGVMRRLNQGNKTAVSPLERAYRDLNPVAYWSLDDGPLADIGGSNITNSTSGRFAITGNIDLAQVPGPIGAPAPLPQMSQDVPVMEVALSSQITANTTTTYTVDLCVLAKPASSDTYWLYAPVQWVDTYGSQWYVLIDCDITIPATPIYLTRLYGYDSAIALDIDARISGINISDGNWHHIRCEVSTLAGTATAAILLDNAWYASDAQAGLAVGNIAHIDIFNNTKNDIDFASVGHIGVFVGDGLPITYNAFLGNPNETIATRIARLSTEDYIATVLYDNDNSTLLTSQRTEALIPLMQDMQAADLGILFESRSSSALVYRALNTLYNQTPIILDYANHEITADEGFQPVDNDQIVWNDITVERYLASKYRVTKTSGPLNTANPPAGIGTYDRGEFTTHIASDKSLPDIANWLLLTGTWDESRYPCIPINLARSVFVSNAQLSADIANSDIGDVVRIDNLPSCLPPGSAYGMIQGYNEVLSNFEWSLELITTPAGPYNIAAVNGVGRVAADNDMTLALAASAAETTMYVFSESGTQRWCHATDDAESGSDYPMDINMAGEILSATACAYTVTDGFNRSSASSWGDADTGQTWDTASSPATFSTAPTYGTIIPTSNSTDCRIVLNVDGCVDHEVRTQLRMPNLTFGTSFRIGIVGRYVNTSNYYIAYLLITPTGVMSLLIAKRLAASPSTLGTFSMSSIYTAGALWRIALRINGSSLQAKAWPINAGEPDWQLSVTDTTITTGTYAGCLARNNGTTTVAQADFTEFMLTSPQKLTVVRGARAKAQTIGTSIEVLNSAHVGL